MSSSSFLLDVHHPFYCITSITLCSFSNCNEGLHRKSVQDMLSLLLSSLECNLGAEWRRRASAVRWPALALPVLYSGLGRCITYFYDR